ncbi:MAG TPA: hypothetical protein VJJ83_05385 [Candidatus Babeliales bacterium]|nr:MAG: hypothetical protein A3F67_01075 [Verrucomicrobia bacterium RIFCSPHIGHO2_12_FULL_41_10]HLB41198.1 hypothetical protein [Candidatus Babeliales bacterium]
MLNGSIVRYKALKVLIVVTFPLIQLALSARLPSMVTYEVAAEHSHDQPWRYFYSGLQAAPTLSTRLASIVTYELVGSRLGDQLIGYMHAKWVAYKYNLPFYYKPFPYSDQLMMHDLEQWYNDDLARQHHKIKLAPEQKLEQFIQSNKPDQCYIIPYFPESYEEFLPTVGPLDYHLWQRPVNYFPYFTVDWTDPVFMRMLKDMIRPRQPLQLVKLPKNCVTIALHVRKNSGGLDFPLLHGLSDAAYNPKQPYVDVIFPLKHPPEEYYIEQLQYLIQRFTGQRLYVYLFTDDAHPEVILARIKQAIKQPMIEFACRTTANNHYSNVLEDLFSITQFDCFIRPDSNFAIAAAKLGSYKVAISPLHHHWEGHRLIIDQVAIQVNR